MESPVAPPARTPFDPTAWPPQQFGSGNAKDVRDPIIEPLWVGLRVVAAVGPDGPPLIVDDAGLILDDVPDIVDAIAAASRASSLILDGYLTRQATRSSEGLALEAPQAPSAADMTAQLFLGSAGQRKRQELVRRRQNETAAGPAAFVAIDLLLVDDEPILDVPLLERKRLLEGVLEEGDLVRRTAFVRPPIDPWLGTWRSIGFGGLAYKAANSRYHPGRPNPDWAIAQIPRR